MNDPEMLCCEDAVAGNEELLICCAVIGVFAVNVPDMDCVLSVDAVIGTFAANVSEYTIVC